MDTFDFQDAFRLNRFLDAQQPVYAQALAELDAGQKRTHWMWFIFPQPTGLGHSPTARHYGISGIAEARAYLTHPTLGPRLLESVRAVIDSRNHDAESIFGFPDHLKFRSSLTLFAEAADSAEHRAIFTEALNLFYAGNRDDATLQLLRNP